MESDTYYSEMLLLITKWSLTPITPPAFFCSVLPFLDPFSLSNYLTPITLLRRHGSRQGWD